MRRSALTVAVVLLALLSTGAVASAQTGGNSTEPTASAPEGERIDNSTVLLNSSYDNETGLASVTLKSETIQEISLYDGAAFAGGGGEIEQRTVQMRPGETATYTLDVTRADDGFVGVVVSTDDLSYAEPIRTGSSTSGGGPLVPQESDLLAMGAGLLSAFGMVWLRKKKRDRDFENGVYRIDG